MRPADDPFAEWLETDGLGGFASGTVCGRRTRRYHALLLTATQPPTGRMALVNGLDALVECSGRKTPLSQQHYHPDVVSPDNSTALVEFRRWPWPTWTYHLPDGRRLVHSLFVPRGRMATVLRWRLVDTAGVNDCSLLVRPFFSGRDYHFLHHENAAFRFVPEAISGGYAWTPYAGVPAFHLLTNGWFDFEPSWYRHFLYDLERERGLDDDEDLAAPGVFRWNLAQQDAVLILTTEPTSLLGVEVDPARLADKLAGHEATRRADSTPLDLAAEQFLVRRTGGATIIAGYPWFTDWGRDTFIAVRGLCFTTGRWDTAAEILSTWAGTVRDGMVPNRFPDAGESPEYNAVDASLWYAFAVLEFLSRVNRPRPDLYAAHHRLLREAVRRILEDYSQGTRYGIRRDSDGLIAAGEPGVQLTWMDAKVGDCVVTPRMGKPVEIQALWLNVLAQAIDWFPPAQDWLRQGEQSFREKFWNAEAGVLFDVIDVDHRCGMNDGSIRPNQVFAVGGLPRSLVAADQVRSAMQAIEQQLLTPLGLRTLSPADPRYRGRCVGGPAERDGAYHQGTVWPWLIGPFVEAWLKLRGDTMEHRQFARKRFLEPLQCHLQTAGLGHISEIADGDSPHIPRGCPFQAWSLAEYLRLDRDILAVK